MELEEQGRKAHVVSSSIVEILDVIDPRSHEDSLHSQDVGTSGAVVLVTMLISALLVLSTFGRWYLSFGIGAGCIRFW